MIINTQPGVVEGIVKDFRRAMQAQINNPEAPDVRKATCRMAESVFPQYLLALAGEMRNDTVVDLMFQAVADLCANTVATVVSSTLPDSDANTKAAAAEQVINSLTEIAVRQFRFEDQKRAAEQPPKQEMN